MAYSNIISAVYLLLNKVNSKLYIGSTTNIHSRWSLHKRQLNTNSHANFHLQSAWNKYGADAFGFSILEECSKDQLLSREQFWLNYTKCYDRNKGYNIKIVPNSNLGLKWSDETKRKLHLAHKGRIKSDEWQEKIKIGIINSPKQFANKRNLEKWPHAGGKRCICEECREKLKTIDRPRRRKKYNEKRGIVILNEMTL